MNGCQVHGHLGANCKLLPENAGPFTKNYLNETYGSVIKRFETQLQYFRNTLKVPRILIQWECSYRRRFSKELNDVELLKQCLPPRLSLRGGKTESICQTNKQTNVNLKKIFNRFIFRPILGRVRKRRLCN